MTIRMATSLYDPDTLVEQELFVILEFSKPNMTCVGYRTHRVCLVGAVQSSVRFRYNVGCGVPFCDVQFCET